MSDPTFGLSITRIDNEPRPAIVTDMSIVGLVFTAPEADADAFTRDANSPEQLRLGRFTVSFQAEEPPVLRYIGIQSARYRPALDALLDDLLTSLDVAA